MNSLCTKPWESKKNISTLSLEFQFLWPRGYLTNPFRILSLCFGIMGKTPGLMSRNNFIKKILSWQDVTRSPLCSGVKKRGTKCTHNFLFPKSSLRIRRTSLGNVQRFCYHSWSNSTVNFEQISNISNVYLGSSPLWTVTSLVIFYQPPSVLKSRIPPKSFWSVQSLIP